MPIALRKYWKTEAFACDCWLFAQHTCSWVLCKCNITGWFKRVLNLQTKGLELAVRDSNLSWIELVIQVYLSH